MVQGGIDVRTGEILPVESTEPIRPLMALPEFMQTFAPLGVARIDMAMNPFPQCSFGRTVCIADQHFSVEAQFSKKTSTSTPGCEVRVSSPWDQLNEEPSTRIPDLRFLRLFARRSAWQRPAEKQKQSRLLLPRETFLRLPLAVRRLFSSKSLAINLPQGYESMEEERVVYESWLSRTVGQTSHEQIYLWGNLKLVNSRSECYFVQFEFLDPTIQRHLPTTRSA